MLKPILIIHPKDKTTKFLDKIKNYIVNNFSEVVHHFNIQFSDISHTQCMERIDNHKENGFIIFLGHGKSNSLYGSIAPNYEAEFVSPDAKIENPDKYYGKEIFIDSSNISVFNGKNVFCLSCNSNGKIAREAIKNGAKCFLGFGDIPSSNGELKQNGESDIELSLSEITKEFKTEINYIIKKSLEIAINENSSFEQIKELIRFITNQRITNILINRKDLDSRKVLVDYLYSFKTEIKIFGDSKQKIFADT